MLHRTLVTLLLLFLLSASFVSADEGEWVSLFDGKSLDGWRASENKESCKVEDGAIVVHGPRSHLFYVGDVNNGSFTNFEFKVDVKTDPGANSGVYFHTNYQETGWPNTGYETQVNNTGGDASKTGGLYAVQDETEAPVGDGEWFNLHITVKGKHIVVKVNGETVSDYTEPDDLDRPSRQLSSGTFAFQAHDPNSRVAYKNVMVKVLP
ncbi:MAG: DUF1080 domain-containing protein [Planctomycetota bacterium]|nr:MAG: DUF1080 domain-containing protein [Planctomycetota bacterium]REJ94120.1 MAG: DUF1080 domain-containing protein [Planctomycetota bacterium]REK26306.1 MAG: DUF1080 domain-containing protein [Planctomycetota bacterium]REK45857.1 MAG: DUF1080 domain-containing protein [Planctomycetota bacterium]